MRYLIDGPSTRTCTVSTGECTDTIDAARVSDVQMTPDFFGTSLAARLRHDAEVAVADPTTSTEDIQGQPATCTSIPVDGSTNTYCVLDNGVLGRMEAGDLVDHDDRLRARRRRQPVHRRRLTNPPEVCYPSVSGDLSAATLGRGTLGGRGQTETREWSALFKRCGPASLATTMSSRRIPHRPPR